MDTFYAVKDLIIILKHSTLKWANHAIRETYFHTQSLKDIKQGQVCFNK